MNYVIIGTGAAGIMAAKEIRKLKKDAQITMISAEVRVPFLEHGKKPLRQ